MGVQPARNLSDRELRSLDLKAFLALVQEDIRELDELRRQRRKPENAERSAARKGRLKAEAVEPQEEDEVVPPSLHAVSCCGKKMGSFPAFSRVRCPFCERWHRAGEFPAEMGT